jgi:hypothetical protein
MTTEKDKLLRKAKLPNKIHFDLVKQKKLQKIFANLSEEEKVIVENTFKLLSKYTYDWEKPDKDYFFGLPPCYFDFENDEIFHIDLPVFDEELARTKLNNTQLNDLYFTGIFEVQSLKFHNNYRWKITPILFKGRDNTKETFRSDIGIAHSLLI